MAHLENHPEGFNALRRMYEDVQEPLMQATADAAQQPPGAGGGARRRGGRAERRAAQPVGLALGGQRGRRRQAARAADVRRNAPMRAPAGMMPPMPGMMGMRAAAGMMPGMPGMPGGMDPAQTLEMMQNPMVQQMMQQMFSDPQMMENVANSNPMLRQLMDANPHTRAMLQNPQFMRQFADPNNLAAVMQMAQLQRGALAPPGRAPAPARASGANPWAGLARPVAAPPAASAPFRRRAVPPAAAAAGCAPPAPAPPLDPIVQNLDFSNLLTQFGSTNISPPPVPRAPVAPQATAPNGGRSHRGLAHRGRARRSSSAAAAARRRAYYACRACARRRRRRRPRSRFPTSSTRRSSDSSMTWALATTRRTCALSHRRWATSTRRSRGCSPVRSECGPAAARAERSP